uniref:M23 family metallopeptidase n=1 Tax=Candidatus Cryptobacteroides bacterium TaxID=3085639 RepID=UPI004028AB21
MKAFLRFCPLLAMLLSLCACVDEMFSLKNDSLKTAVNKGSFEDILVQRNNLLFTNVKSSGTLSRTRSASDGSDLVSLESLLDRSKTETIVFKNYHIVQIPFKQSEEDGRASLSDSDQDTFVEDIISVVRKFLVEISDTLSGTRRQIVATLVPTPDNCRIYGADSYSYINKETFEGVILYSDLDGSFRSVNSYGLRPIRDAYVIDPKDSLNYFRVRYINVYEAKGTTRGSVNGGQITESVCVAEMPKEEDDGWMNSSSDDDRWIDEEPRGGRTGGGTSGGSNSRGTTGGKGPNTENVIDSCVVTGEYKPKKEEDDVIWYSVSLYSVGKGSTSGSGRYSNREHKYVVCEAIPDANAYFDRWTGDFSGRGEVLEFLVNKDVTSTAYFASMTGDFNDPLDPANRPCFSKATKVGNPLNNMSIASPGWSGLRGGTFGYVRNGGTKFHSGLDLYAEEGTPVYAMMDGVISSYRYVVEQPNRDTKYYPPEYQGNTNGAGNRIYIKGRHNNQDVMVGYWHLQAGTPVAINPRTREMFKPGDMIYRGELLGYTGRTGNAYNVTNKHLHFVYMVKNSNGGYVYANPEEIINGSVNWKDGDPSTKKIIGGKIVGVECDTEEKVNIL